MEIQNQVGHRLRGNLPQLCNVLDAAASQGIRSLGQVPRLSTDSIGGLSSPTVNWNHTRLRLQNLVFCGANACSDRKVMQLAGEPTAPWASDTPPTRRSDAKPSTGHVDYRRDHSLTLSNRNPLRAKDVPCSSTTRSATTDAGDVAHSLPSSFW